LLLPSGSDTQASSTKVSERSPRKALQLCPNDKLAFREICRNHARALIQAGFDVSTIFFAGATADGEFPGRVDYLGHHSLKGKTSRIRRQIDELLKGQSPELIVTHRYRALRVAIALNHTRVRQRLPPAETILALAHEYGFLRALPELPPGTSLVFIGAGSERATLNSAIHAAGLENRVRLAGHVPHAHRYLQAFDAVLVAAGRREAFGMILLEAMLARVPVICADSPGPRQVLQGHGHSFELQNPASLAAALKGVFTDGCAEASAERLEGARQHVIDTYSIPILEEIYAHSLALDRTVY